MKPATIAVFGLLFCAIVLFASATAEDATQDIKPQGDTEFGAEMASGRCIHGCCNRRTIIRTCKVCCASAEEAQAFEAQLMKEGMGRRAGATAEAQVNP